MKRVRGLAALITDAVVHGASAVEEVHLATARRPFAILEKIPVVALPTYAVHVVHDVCTKGVYAAVRGTARVVGKGVDLALDASDG